MTRRQSASTPLDRRSDDWTTTTSDDCDDLDDDGARGARGGGRRRGDRRRRRSPSSSRDRDPASASSELAAQRRGIAARTRSGTSSSELAPRDDTEMFDADGDRRKLIIFTEHRDTLNYLVERLRTLLGRPEAVVHDPRRHAARGRREAQERSPRTRTSSSWSPPTPPARASTSSGRTCSSTTTCPGTRTASSSASGASTASARPRSATCGTSSPTRPAKARSTSGCSRRSAEQRKALGGQVFDVLGEALPRAEPPRSAHRGHPLRRPTRGPRPAVQTVDDAAVRHPYPGPPRQSAPSSPMRWTPRRCEEIREDGGAEARRLQPHYIRAFFLEAFKQLGGPSRTGAGALRDHPCARCHPEPGPGDRARRRVLDRYERICFEKELVSAGRQASRGVRLPRAPAPRRHHRPHPGTVSRAPPAGRRPRRSRPIRRGPAGALLPRTRDPRRAGRPPGEPPGRLTALPVRGNDGTASRPSGRVRPVPGLPTTY